MRKYRTKILVAAIVAFILLVILGYAMKPDKTWGPPAQQQTQTR